MGSVHDGQASTFAVVQIFSFFTIVPEEVWMSEGKLNRNAHVILEEIFNLVILQKKRLCSNLHNAKCQTHN